MPFAWYVWRLAWGLNGGDERVRGYRHLFGRVHWRVS